MKKHVLSVLIFSLALAAVQTVSASAMTITAGPDGNLWFTESSGNKIGRITTTGTITEFAIPTAKSLPVSITSSPDGNLWFTEEYGYNIGKITTTGAITEFTSMSAEEQAAFREINPCDEVVQKLCKNVQGWERRMTKCLKEHEKDLSPQCRAMISVPKETRLKSRIQELHAAIGAKDVNTWYAIVPPYIRTKMTLEDFTKEQRLDQATTDSSPKKTLARLEKLCYPCGVIGPRPETLRCYLIVHATTEEPEKGKREDRIGEVWEYIDGEWYWGMFGEYSSCGEDQ